ncbi:MAG TPA: cupin domain-containing protein [Vicinamibacterales bacterium]|nr:cupin domain-containing protein [Vicinamibacterales bacterium]
MPNAPPILFRWADIELDKVTEMVSRKEIQCDGESLVQTYLKKGALVPTHTHGGHQWVYVLQGTLRVMSGGEAVIANEGDVVRIAAGADHQAEALEDTFLMTVTGDDR